MAHDQADLQAEKKIEEARHLKATSLSVSNEEVLQRELGEDKYRPAPLLRKSGRGFYQY